MAQDCLLVLTTGHRIVLQKHICIHAALSVHNLQRENTEKVRGQMRNPLQIIMETPPVLECFFGFLSCT